MAASFTRVVDPFIVETEWLARGHGHPPTSDDDARGRLSRGVASRLAGRVREQAREVVADRVA